jgi:NTP pyrophosphatase (non-canonical NTP hydrolase)
MNKNDVYSAAVREWGWEAQERMIYEEIGELMQAISKYHRDPSEENRIRIGKEASDLIIVVEQSPFIYGFEPSVLEDERRYKLNRLMSRLGINP